MLAILGIILAIVGILGLVDLVAIPTVGNILLIVAGVLLVAWDRRAWLNTRL